MKTLALPAAALVAALLASAAPAHAEKWVYYPVPGGAMAYDADSVSAETASTTSAS